MAAIVWQKKAPQPIVNFLTTHVHRVQEEMRRVGATRYGRTKFSSQYLHHIIHPDEHIRAVVYGRYKGGNGLLNYTEGMLVATDRRVIFLDYKPAFTSVEEFTYEVVSGVEYITAGPFSSLTVHTKLGDFTLTYGNPHCVRMFVKYLEQRRIEQNETAAPIDAEPISKADYTPTVDIEAVNFLRCHRTGVISTLSRENVVHGAAVHYIVGADAELFVITKAGTQKAHNLIATHQAALTVFDTEKVQTVQLGGTAEIETRQNVKDWVFAELAKPKEADGSGQLPPSAQLNDGAFIVFRIMPHSARLLDFSHRTEANNAQA